MEKTKTWPTKINKIDTYKQLVFFAREGIAIIQNYKFKFMNPSMCKILGIENEKIATESPYKIFVPTQALHQTNSIYKRLMQNLFSEEAFSIPIINYKSEKIEVKIKACSTLINKKKSIIIYARDITKHKQAEKDNYMYKKKLEESNLTLREVLKNIEEEKINIKETIALNIENNLKPIIKKLRTHNPSNTYLLHLLEETAESLTSDFYIKIINLKHNLTTTERQVCQLIKSGHDASKISKLLGISSHTVHDHRKSIRKKLKLTGSSINLRTFLNELPQ